MDVKDTITMSKRRIEGGDLQADIDRLKETASYRDRFERESTQQLCQAVDILTRLQNAAKADASQVGYEKLRNAKLYLDNMLQESVASEEEDNP